MSEVALISDDEADLLRSEYDTASPQRQAYIGTALSQYQGQQDEIQRQKTGELLLGVYTDPAKQAEFWNQPSMQRAAENSTAPEATKMRITNQAFFATEAGLPISDLDDTYDFHQDEYTRKYFGKVGMSDAETFAAIQQRQQKTVYRRNAVAELYNDAIADTISAYRAGKPLPSSTELTGSWMARYPGLDPADGDQSSLLRYANGVTNHLAPILQKYGPQINQTADMLGELDAVVRDSSSDAYGFNDRIDALAKSLLTVPSEDREAIYECAAAFVRKNAPPKGFSDMVINAGNAAQDSLQKFGLKLFSLVQDRATQNQIDSLEAQGGDPGKIQALKDELGISRIKRELVDAMTTKSHPVSNIYTGAGGFAESMLYGASSMAPDLIVAQAPIVGPSLTFAGSVAEQYDETMLKYPDISVNDASELALVKGGAQTALTYLTLGSIAGKLPTTSAFFKGLSEAPPSILKTFGKITLTGVDLAIASEASLAMPTIVDGAAKTLGMDLPQFNWDDQLKALKDAQYPALVTGLPFFLVGAGAIGLRDLPAINRNFSDANWISENTGLDKDEAAKVASEFDPEKKQKVFQTLWAGMPEAQKQDLVQRYDAQAAVAQAANESPAGPTFQGVTGTDEKGAPQQQWAVLNKEGREIFRSADLDAAMDAYHIQSQHEQGGEGTGLKNQPDQAPGETEGGSPDLEKSPAPDGDGGAVESQSANAKPVGEPEAHTDNPYRDAEGKLKVAEGESAAGRDPALAGYEAKMKSIVDNPEAADAIYNGLEETFGGKVIGTDLYRDLLPEYAAGREGRIRHVETTALIARAAARDRLWRELVNPGGRRKLLFTAGGIAAGKSTAVSQERVAKSDLVYDGTLRETRWAIDTIRLARQHGWNVAIDYVQRPMDLVIQGAIDRSQKSGRWVSLASLPEAHQKAQESILAIADAFRNDPDVQIQYWLNGGTKENPAPAKALAREDIDAGGKLSYYENSDRLGPEDDSGDERIASGSFSQRGQREVRTAFQRAVESGKYDPEILANLAKGDPRLEGLVEKGEGAQKPETDRSPEIAAPKLKPAPVVPVENGHVSPTDLKPESYDFIESSLGHAGWGEISPEIVSQAKEQLLPGEIRIQEGVHFSDGTGFGWIHAHDHEKGIRKAGWASVKDFLADTLSGFDEIWRQPNGRFLLVKRGGSMAGTPVQPSGKLPSVPVAVVELQPSAGFYGLTTAFLERAKRDLSKKNTLVWERSVPAIANLGKSNAP